MNFISKDLARYAAYPRVKAFQVDLRRYHWPLRPVKRIQGRNRYAFPEAVLAHVISVLRHIGISASSVAEILDRLDQIAFKQALDGFEANLVEEVILTLPISRYSVSNDECDLETVHTSIVSAHETLDEIDALYIRLTDISRGIKEGHI
jgi:predicted nucleic acid-binding protein